MQKIKKGFNVMKRLICCTIVLILCLSLFVACSDKHEYKVSENARIVLDGEKVTHTEGASKTDKENIKVKFELENGGTFVMELYPKYAPETVANFCDLVNEGFYEGIIFHRVIPGFMAQAGDPTGTGMGGSEKKIKGEFANNGFDKNTLKHERGTVSMARTNDPNSASSQFFICFEETSYLDNEYAAFGKVVYGMEAVDEIGEATTDENDKPLVDIVIKKASIITDEEFSNYPKND